MTIQRMDHVSVVIDDVDATVAGLRAHGVKLIGEVAPYQDSYRLGYVRGPEGIIVALTAQLGRQPIADNLRPNL
ncbi:VOC family protein [Rhodococcus chondri]|uniref:VOC domain-containing protein n=1 Tax=Rhodococcus chondri TaxID=3065941 RepID=A0ABU7JZR5_9NOCA|nr:hypothetical protein [Rhodococcus sp. CC-R104]MEE2035069.1 hypothetical protein [Rhodococcus sp. CC-R104]